jgi:RNA recognition motif-containing protein
MGKRLFVGSLPFETTENQLHELFAAVGTVESATLITDRNTGWSKGFGFVEMSTDAEALAAIEKLNNSKVGARAIVVNEARPMEKRDFSGGRSGHEGRGGRDGNRKRYY